MECVHAGLGGYPGSCGDRVSASGGCAVKERHGFLGLLNLFGSAAAAMGLAQAVAQLEWCWMVTFALLGVMSLAGVLRWVCLGKEVERE